MRYAYVVQSSDSLNMGNIQLHNYWYDELFRFRWHGNFGTYNVMWLRNDYVCTKFESLYWFQWEMCLRLIIYFIRTLQLPILECESSSDTWWRFPWFKKIVQCFYYMHSTYREVFICLAIMHRCIQYFMCYQAQTLLNIR